MRPMQVYWLLIFLLIVISAITTLSLVVKIDADRNLRLNPDFRAPSAFRGCNQRTNMVQPFNIMTAFMLRAQE
ncbi:hypothetical protein EGM70_20380 [Enterobacteriaceae bacterium 89]|nr:hypothetical protein [Enterobacteriaceae bacterium 89]